MVSLQGGKKQEGGILRDSSVSLGGWLCSVRPVRQCPDLELWIPAQLSIWNGCSTQTRVTGFCTKLGESSLWPLLLDFSKNNLSPLALAQWFGLMNHE